MLENLSPNKILKYLSLGLGVVCALILIKEIVLKPKPLPSFEILPPSPRIELDFESFESPEVKELLPFEEIGLPKKIGREHPFEQYKIEEEAEEEEATTTEEE